MTKDIDKYERLQRTGGQEGGKGEGKPPPLGGRRFGNTEDSKMGLKALHTLTWWVGGFPVVDISLICCLEL